MQGTVPGTGVLVQLYVSSLLEQRGDVRCREAEMIVTLTEVWRDFNFA
jgi:hypothetical protein